MNMQYNNSKFKQLLIDLNAATRFTGSFGQLKALAKFFFEKLGKLIARLTSFVLKIRSISFIGIVNLNTLFEIIVFYIV